MAIINPFDLLGDDDNDDTSNLMTLHKKLAEERAEQEKIEKEHARVNRILERKLKSLEDARKRDDEYIDVLLKLKAAKVKLEDAQKALETAKAEAEKWGLSNSADLATNVNRKQNPEEEKARGKVIDCEKDVVKKESIVKSAEANLKAANGRGQSARKEARIAEEAFQSLDKDVIPADFYSKLKVDRTEEVSDPNSPQHEETNGYVSDTRNAREIERPRSRQSNGSIERPRSRNGSVNLDQDGYQVPSRKHQSRSINGNEKSNDGGSAVATTKSPKDDASTQETVDNTKAVEKVEKPVKEKSVEKKAEKPVKAKAADKPEKKAKEEESQVSDANNANKEKEVPEEKLMSLKEYEKIKEEKRKQLLAGKTTSQRTVDVEKEFEAMQLLSVKKENNEVFFQGGSEKNGGKKKEKNASQGASQVKKSVSARELLSIKYSRPPAPPRSQFREGESNQARVRDDRAPAQSNGNQVRGRDRDEQAQNRSGGYRAQTTSPSANGNQGRGQSNGGFRTQGVANGNRGREQRSVHTPSLENPSDFPPLK